jgi:hypothetical protein
VADPGEGGWEMKGFPWMFWGDAKCERFVERLVVALMALGLGAVGFIEP